MSGCWAAVSGFPFGENQHILIPFTSIASPQTTRVIIFLVGTAHCACYLWRLANLMVRLFHPAYDNRLTGTVTSLESLQRLFAQNEGSGMIELHVALERVVLILMLSSRMVANFLVENEVVVGFDLVNLPRIGCGVTSPISYLQLSTQAVRAAWQAFEWNFGRQTVLAGPSPVESLEALKFENADGLLRLGIGSWCSGMEPTPWLTC